MDDVEDELPKFSDQLAVFEWEMQTGLINVQVILGPWILFYTPYGGLVSTTTYYSDLGK